MNRPALFLAVALHAALLARCAPDQPPAASESAAHPAAKDSEPLAVTLLPAPRPGGTLPCADTYIGLGFTTGWGGGWVSSVAQGGPAERAGLRVGDNVTNADGMHAWQMPGVRVTLHVERDGHPLTMVAETAEICYAT